MAFYRRLLDKDLSQDYNALEAKRVRLYKFLVSCAAHKAQLESPLETKDFAKFKTNMLRWLGSDAETKTRLTQELASLAESVGHDRMTGFLKNFVAQLRVISDAASAADASDKSKPFPGAMKREIHTTLHCSVAIISILDRLSMHIGNEMHKEVLDAWRA